jgi:hypothetical protein
MASLAEHFGHDSLVVYEGGGYSGCFWEYNAFLIDSEGQFHDLLSSGALGLRTEDEAAYRLVDGSPYTQDSYNAECIDLTSKNSIAKFSEEYNATLVLTLLTKIAEKPQADDYPLVVVCGTCGQLVDPDSAPELTSLGHDGGLAYSHRDIMCSECAQERTCEGCGDLYDDPIESSKDLDRHCGYCVAALAEKEHEA